MPRTERVVRGSTLLSWLRKGNSSELLAAEPQTRPKSRLPATNAAFSKSLDPPSSAKATRPKPRAKKPQCGAQPDGLLYSLYGFSGNTIATRHHEQPISSDSMPNAGPQDSGTVPNVKNARRRAGITDVFLFVFLGTVVVRV